VLVSVAQVVEQAQGPGSNPEDLQKKKIHDAYTQRLRAFIIVFSFVLIISRNISIPYFLFNNEEFTSSKKF
jgi:hypothetical protein